MTNKRALVVDDSKVGRLTMKKRLEAIGVVVDLVESAQQALDYLTQHRPDMIFMDHLMPDMDGFEATRRIKAAPATRDIPIIIISGSDDEEFVREARAIGAIQAISKPPAASALEAILSSIRETVTAAAPSAVMEAAPTPVAVERRAAPFMDQAAVHALVERVLGEVVEHLHGDLAELRTQVDTALENERKTLREWDGRWSEKLDQALAGIADLRREGVDAETLRQQLNAIEQRLPPLESEAVQTEPDLNAVLEKIEQQVASRLAEIQARAERQEPMLEGLRQELLTKVGDQHAQAEQGVGELASRLDSLSEDMKRLSDGTRSSEAGHDQRLAAIEQRLATIESTEPTPGLDAETMLAAMDAHIEPRLAEMRNELQAQFEARSSMPLEEAVREGLSDQLREQHEALRSELDAQRTQAQAMEKLQDALKVDLVAQGERLQATMEEGREQFMTRYELEQARLAAGLEEQRTRLEVCDDGWTQRLQALAARLDEMVQAGIGDGAQQVQDAETMLADVDAHIAPRLAEMRNELLAQFEARSSIPLEEAMRESLSGQLREQDEALRSEFGAQLGQVQAMEQQQDALKAELVAMGERLEAKMAEEREQLMARQEQERMQLAAGLEGQQTRLEACDDGWTQRLQALEVKLDEMAQAGIDAGVQRVLEQRIAQMREVISAALQPVYPDRERGADEAPSLMCAPSAEEGSARPATEAEHDIEERVAQRLAERWNDRLRAEVVQLEGKVKVLSVMIAVGGAALLAAIATLALLR
jgi:CheY-like chemotaxis protein